MLAILILGLGLIGTLISISRSAACTVTLPTQIRVTYDSEVADLLALAAAQRMQIVLETKLAIATIFAEASR